MIYTYKYFILLLNVKEVSEGLRIHILKTGGFV